MRELFLASWLALPFVLFGLLTLRRKARLRSLASALGARYVARGWFAPGTVAGERFEIEVERAGKSYCTRVRLEVNTPGTYLLRPGFFGETLDWSCAWVPGTRTERVFLWNLALPGFASPTEEQRNRLLRWLGCGAERRDAQAALAAAGIREVFIGDGALSVRFRGIVTDLARLQGTLDVLRGLTPDARPAYSTAA